MNLPDQNRITADPFEQVTTFGQLKSLLPSTGSRTVPGIEQLKSMASVVLQAKTESGLIKVYDNGFYTYTEHGWSTVYGVDRCSVLDWFFCNNEVGSSKGFNLDNLPWEVPLEIAGTNRLEHNSESRQESMSDCFLDAPESRDKLRFSVPPEHELLDEQVEYLLRKRKRRKAIAEEYASLTYDQRRLVQMVYFEKVSQAKAATILGINQSNISRRLERIKCHFKKFL